MSPSGASPVPGVRRSNRASSIIGWGVGPRGSARVAELDVFDDVRVNAGKLGDRRARAEEVHGVEDQSEVWTGHLAHRLNTGHEISDLFGGGEFDAHHHPAFGRHVGEPPDLFNTASQVRLEHHGIEYAHAEFGP